MQELVDAFSEKEFREREKVGLSREGKKTTVITQ